MDTNVSTTSSQYNYTQYPSMTSNGTGTGIDGKTLDTHKKKPHKIPSKQSIQRARAISELQHDLIQGFADIKNKMSASTPYTDDELKRLCEELPDRTDHSTMDQRFNEDGLDQFDTLSHLNEDSVLSPSEIEVLQQIKMSKSSDNHSKDHRGDHADARFFNYMEGSDDDSDWGPRPNPVSFRPDKDVSDLMLLAGKQKSGDTSASRIIAPPPIATFYNVNNKENMQTPIDTDSFADADSADIKTETAAGAEA